MFLHDKEQVPEMKHAKLFVLAVLAVFAVGVVGASAAMAEEAPYFSNGSNGRLKAGETRAFTTTKTSETYELKAGTITISCKEQFTKNGKLIGSNAGEPGTNEETVEFKKCTTTGNGTPCTVSEPIVTEPLKTTLAEDSAKKSSITIFEPKVGTSFAKLTFSGTCNVTSTLVEGKVASQNLNSKSELIELGKASPEEASGFVNFPATRIASAWVVKAGVGASTTIKLNAFGVTSTLVGKTSVALVGGGNWSILP